MIRFGYVTMFLTVFPGAPFFVVLTNTLEMHLDVQCSLEAHRRPAAVTVNCALLYLTTDIHAYLPTSFFAADAATSTAKLWVLLGVEHLVLGIKAAMALGIPDSPPWVDAYYAKLAKTHLISPPPTRSAEATAVGAASNNEDKQGSFEVETMECMEQPTLDLSKMTSGAMLTMPMLLINMGGEMLYVLDQRLKAQNISGDKSVKGTFVTG
ncbi:hypothetical protein DYB28_007661 [Aphanomyces astaci]|uniref:Anoctamin transmembrane domain-containing protein n=1 Tax=Aphanomyces astaci TaxID=112090 RepID=A0A9X8ECZ5_APHAT|nr:hypothetical protein DYB28_007661 [Aphanomyces astaci]